MESYDKEPFAGFEKLLNKNPSLLELKSILEHRDFVQFLSNIALIAN